MYVPHQNVALRDIPILYETDEIFVINKPAGVSVQGGAGISHPLDAEFSRQVGFKVFLVHRLDKETCGLMLVAKSAAAASRWISLVASRQVQKEYTAVCMGIPVLGGKPCRSGTIRASVSKNGRELPAVTDFSVEKTRSVSFYTGEGFPEQDDASGTGSGGKISLELSLVRLLLGTGRTHQIRIHLASVRAPVCGDDKYGNFRLNKAARKQLGIKNLLLCASGLSIPVDGTFRRFEIPLPPYFPEF